MKYETYHYPEDCHYTEALMNDSYDISLPLVISREPTLIYYSSKSIWRSESRMVG